MKWFDLDGLDAEIQQNLVELLKAVAASTPDRLANSMHKGLKDQFDVDELVENAAMLSPIGGRYGNEFVDGLIGGISASEDSIRTTAEETLENVFASDFDVRAKVNIVPDYFVGTGATPSFITESQNPQTLFPVSQQSYTGHAAGGYVSSPELSWLAEEGYGEFIIPTNPSRRSRALELYEQAGAALGVSADADSGEAVPVYGNVTAERAGSDTGTPPVQVSVDMTPQFIINSADGQSEEDIMQVIRRHMKEMADELGGEIAVNLKEVFSNMPLKARRA